MLNKTISDHAIIQKLTEIVGAGCVLVDDASKSVYGKDLTQVFSPNPVAIVFPTTEQHIVSLVKFANEINIGLVPSGGRTGYSGGAVAMNHEVVVSFEKFNRLLEINLADRQIKCDPGIKTAQIHALADQNNLFYPVDFASSGSSHIGGNVATNAGGIKVIRYGLTRNYVVGLRVVTGEGEVLSLNNGLIKNASGYDLRHLFIGSEGTLGFITQITLRLIKPEIDKITLLFSIQESSCLIDVLNEFRNGTDITAFEFFTEKALHYVMEGIGVKHPFKHKQEFYVLLECENTNEVNGKIAKIVEQCIGKNWIHDALVSQNMTQSEGFWRYREGISMSLLKYTPFKCDISVMPSKIADFMRQADVLLARLFPDNEIIWFGHVGDGNLHLNILKSVNQTKEQFFDVCHERSVELYDLVSRYEGSVSAEHGIGLLKKELLPQIRSKAEIELFKGIKRVFDPKGIMNPGKLID